MKASVNAIMNDDLAAFLVLRDKTLAAIRRVLAIEAHGKSYEGRFEVTFPDAFEGQAFSFIHPSVCWAVTLHCYVLGPNRHYTWEGQTLGECVGKADADITSWIEEWEREQTS